VHTCFQHGNELNIFIFSHLSLFFLSRAQTTFAGGASRRRLFFVPSTGVYPYRNPVHFLAPTPAVAPRGDPRRVHFSSLGNEFIFPAEPFISFAEHRSMCTVALRAAIYFSSPVQAFIPVAVPFIFLATTPAVAPHGDPGRVHFSPMGNKFIFPAEPFISSAEHNSIATAALRAAVYFSPPVQAFIPAAVPFIFLAPQQAREPRRHPGRVHFPSLGNEFIFLLSPFILSPNTTPFQRRRFAPPFISQPPCRR